MSGEMRMVMRALVHAVVGTLLVPGAVLAQKAPAQKTPAQKVPGLNYEDQYARYLEAARTTPPPSESWMEGLFSDTTARRANDLVTVRIIESVSATGTADRSIGKSSSAGVNAPWPWPISWGLSKVLPFDNDSKFQGNGSTSRASAITAVLAARVVEVLPNGDLAIEGVRELEINGDRQLVVLSGVIRTADVGRDNVVLSSVIGQLSIRCLGKGRIEDGVTPGWLIRVLNKVF